MTEKLPSAVSADDQTKTNRVYQHLRRQIREMTLLPGAHLQKDEIAAELGVSRAPVSEAIARLEKEMLVDVFPRHGSFVAPIRAQEVHECLLIRIALEVEAARWVTQLEESGLVERLEDTLSLQSDAMRRGDVMSFYDLDEHFHSLFFEALGFARAGHLSVAARVPMDRPRLFAQPVQERAEQTLLEHRRIIDAVALRDAEFAGAAMRAHLTMSMRAVEYGLSQVESDAENVSVPD